MGEPGGRGISRFVREMDLRSGCRSGTSFRRGSKLKKL